MMGRQRSGATPDRSPAMSDTGRGLRAALAVAALLAGSAALASPVTLDWDTLTWLPAGNTNLSETYAIGNGNVTVTFGGNTAELDQATNPSPELNTQNQGGLVPAELSLYVATEYTDTNNNDSALKVTACLVPCNVLFSLAAQGE